MPINRVVAAVDGSPSSLHAVDWAADDAVRRGVPLYLVHACPSWHGVGTESGPERGEARRLLESAAERAALHRPGAAVETEVLPGEAASVLLGLDRPDSLLVLGSRGHGALTGALLGSVSLEVVSRAAFPVVVVRGDPAHRAPWHGGVVLAAGPHGTAQAAIDFAVQEAALRRTALHVLHAWWPERELSGPPVYAHAGMAAQRARELVAAVGLPSAPAGVRLGRNCAPGSAASVLLKAGADAHLLVVGAERRPGGNGHRLGPVNHAVLHHAVCAVAVVPGS